MTMTPPGRRRLPRRLKALLQAAFAHPQKGAMGGA